MRNTMFTCVLVLLGVAGPAHAQFAVIDPANLAQAIVIAERTWQHHEELRRQFETIRKMAEGLGDMDRFRTPPIFLAQHEPALWPYGGRWLEGLNSGDPLGVAYAAAALPLARIEDASTKVSQAARSTFERQYSTVEIADAAAQAGGHQVALVRDYYGRVQRAIAALEGDVVSRRGEYHEMTAVLDKLAAGELIARGQDTAINQLVAYALEQLLARGKGLRDTEATAINMQIGTWRDGHEANAAFVAGTGDALQAWRQP